MTKKDRLELQKEWEERTRKAFEEHPDYEYWFESLDGDDFEYPDGDSSKLENE